MVSYWRGLDTVHQISDSNVQYELEGAAGLNLLPKLRRPHTEVDSESQVSRAINDGEHIRG